MRSMTGYGEASGENARHGITVSLRAVNHGFLDLQLRLGEELRGSEAALRDAIGKEVSRGRVEARVELRPIAERKATVQVNMSVIREAHVAVHQLVENGLIERGQVEYPEWGGVLQVRASPAFRELVLFTPPHRRAVCLEPYTCPTDAIHLQEQEPVGT